MVGAFGEIMHLRVQLRAMNDNPCKEVRKVTFRPARETSYDFLYIAYCVDILTFLLIHTSKSLGISNVHKLE